MFEDDERKGTHRQCLPLSQRRANNNWFRSFAHPQRSKSHILRLSVFTGWLQLCCVSFGMKHSYLFPRRSCRCASSQQRHRVSFQGTSHVTPISAKPKMGKQEQLQMLQSWPISPSDISKMTLRRRRMQKKNTDITIRVSSSLAANFSHQEAFLDTSIILRPYSRELAAIELTHVL